MDKKAWIIFSVVVVAAFGGLIYLSHKNKIDVSGIDTNSIIAASSQNGNIGDHVFGKKDSSVRLVEYGDFQCPGCGGAYPTLKEVSEKYQDKIAFIFRNFPLTTLHPNARAAAAAAEAAGLAGKYWEMHNSLYENQKNWESLSADDRTSTFATYAKEVGVDPATFTKNLDEPAINQKISFDQAIGKKVGVDATPTIFFDGQKLPDDVTNSIIQGDDSKLIALIEAKL